MSDRESWLKLKVEEALDPELRICDPHHHLWDYPGNRYLLDEFRQDIGSGHRIVSTVFVECLQNYRETGPHSLKPVGETQFVERLVKQQSGRSTAIAAGIVGFADLSLGAEVQATLEAHMQTSERFRGIRHASAWHSSAKIHNAHSSPPEGLLMKDEFRAGFACLETLGLSFDAWLYHPQITELIDLARTFPGVTIVLDHMAGPLGIGPFADQREEVFETWQNGIEQLANCENVYIKLGGRAMTLSGFGWHKWEIPPGSAELAEAMGPYFRTCIEHFGAARCMFESNFPVDKASCSYTVLWNAFKRLSSDYSEAARAALFHDTACRVYDLQG